ncbi:hypothetical protein Bca101_067036 [Brassica carinata]
MVLSGSTVMICRWLLEMKVRIGEPTLTHLENRVSWTGKKLEQSQKLHRRIETEAAPQTLYERRDETSSSMRIVMRSSVAKQRVSRSSLRRIGSLRKLHRRIFADIDIKAS